FFSDRPRSSRSRRSSAPNVDWLMGAPLTGAWLPPAALLTRLPDVTQIEEAAMKALWGHRVVVLGAVCGGFTVPALARDVGLAVNERGRTSNTLLWRFPLRRTPDLSC
ncbi:MAG TPA: hypothetical protein VFQ48_08930, partial [Pseudonocardiaceae bacterium]|nr:hypothetical protein [Pseudonocardiaceae bacterium]